MIKIEDLNFSRLIYNFLKKKKINTILDIQKIDYNIIKNEKDIFNVLASRLHSSNMLFDFEIPLYNIINQKLSNGEFIKVEDLTMISSHTRTALNKLNINYIDELCYLSLEDLNKVRINERGEINFLLQTLNIKLIDNSNTKLICLNQKLDEINISIGTLLELKFIGCYTISDYVHKKAKNETYCLSDNAIKEIENFINDFSVENNPILELKALEKEVDELYRSNQSKEETILELERIKKERDRLLKKEKRLEQEFLKKIKS